MDEFSLSHHVSNIIGSKAFDLFQVVVERMKWSEDLTFWISWELFSIGQKEMICGTRP